uniref:Secreted protein n=1 Tax=Mesocestoides corti TaxID=53468 RepID=A0A5K3G160_MESCO
MSYSIFLLGYVSSSSSKIMLRFSSKLSSKESQHEVIFCEMFQKAKSCVCPRLLRCYLPAVA